ncbi:MAG: restriction endonuclease subunit S [Chitinophaga sp.]|uniref:restriction endonuclease subunit S n=1 Tax=Chitinophaga sp. TaxID=1869181 RepID=UPI0025BBB0C9|nr:restriction endonuclease subunit S [Chitinophaga sp.]MBV8252421.1 restriction endonuclease subunit S [Chitinophaga sp.]
MEEMVETVGIEKYSAYKDSGVEWIGKIPAHWDLVRFKFTNKIFNGDSLNEKEKSYYERNIESDIPYISTKDIDLSDSTINYNNGLRIPHEEKKYKKAPANSFLLCIEGGSAGKKVGYLNQTVCFVNKLACFVTEAKSDSRYYFYFVKSIVFQHQFNSAMIGLIGGVSISALRDFKTILPPIEEQKSIATFLNQKIALIDKTIAQKTEQINLLKERQQILIHKTVTQGLNSGVKMKDSGVEWIGEIPEHWEVMPLRFLGNTQNGISKGGEYFGSGYPFVSYGDVYNGIELPSDVNGLANSSSDDRRLYSVIEGDIFFTRTSETIEEIGFASTCVKTIENATFSGFLIRFRPFTNKLHKLYSKYYFSSRTHRPFFVREMNLVIRASLSQELLKQLKVLLPPLAEQKEIAEYLELHSRNHIALISKKQQEITKLKEYKSTLINAAVTGKIKVC